MRIELPAESWSDRAHAQEDAYTLTLPLQLVQRSAAAAPLQAEQPPPATRVSTAAAAPSSITLTF